MDATTDMNNHAKRSHSCTPLLDVDMNRRDQRRSSSVHTLLQIRRDSVKISEEFANLTAQLSVAVNKKNLPAGRSSLSVPHSPRISINSTPTIHQLIAGTRRSHPLVIPNSYLTVNTNGTSVPNQDQQHRGRS